MLRFSKMLKQGFFNAGILSEIWEPPIIFGRLAKSTNTGLGKWLGYIDKWIIFPIILKFLKREMINDGPDFRFHICDHSNAPYLKHLPKDLTSITCHDVLAIRGAFGFKDAYCPASTLGKIYQKWILQNLNKSRKLAAVSNHTLYQLQEIAPHQKLKHQRWVVIHNAFNADFQPMKSPYRDQIVRKLNLQDIPFLLHVGSGLPRKNRKMLLQMAISLGEQWGGHLCFAGEALDDDFLALVETFCLSNRIISIVNPNHETLVALYSTCEAFVFPSFSEGFGWPIIEAQSCGAPVITSNMEPMLEVSGGGALYADVNDPQSFANLFISLRDIKLRSNLIKKGFQNSKRFNLTKTINQYLNLHELTTISE